METKNLTGAILLHKLRYKPDALKQRWASETASIRIVDKIRLVDTIQKSTLCGRTKHGLMDQIKYETNRGKESVVIFDAVQRYSHALRNTTGVSHNIILFEIAFECYRKIHDTISEDKVYRTVLNSLIPYLSLEPYKTTIDNRNCQKSIKVINAGLYGTVGNSQFRMPTDKKLLLT